MFCHSCVFSRLIWTEPQIVQKRFVELFAGLGGFHIGLSRMGCECVYSCEADPMLRALYEQNFKRTPHGDIRTLDADQIPDHEILCAGFPCQPFSKAGEQKGTGCKLAGDLFEKHLLRIVDFHRPRFLLLENVPNLARHNMGRTYAFMRESIEKLGYQVDQRVLSPHRFGIPQIRERLFIVACRDGLSHYRWPAPTDELPSIYSVLDDDPADAKPISQQYIDCLTVWQEFLDLYPVDEELPSFPIWTMEFGADYPCDQSPLLLSLRQLCRYRGTHGIKLRDLSRKERLNGLPTYALTQDYPRWKIQFIRQNRALYERNKTWIRPWLTKLKPFPPSLQKFEWNCKGGERNVWEYILQFRASGVRVKRPTTAPALVAMTTTQVPIIASARRYMTARECSRLQSMGEIALPIAPTRAYKALGNAVNAELVQLIAQSLLGAYEEPVRMVGGRTMRAMLAV
jgi:DNA (cytosine-5)-methyltransferase 1